MARHEVEGALGVELARAVGEHGNAEVPGRQQHVDEPADPRPVGGRPEEIAGPGEEVVRELDAGQMAEQYPVRVQRAFGRAGGARGVDDQRRIVGGRVDGCEARRCTGEERMEILAAGGGAVAADEGGETRQAVLERQHLGHAFGIGDQRLRRAVGEPVFERVGAEQREQGHGDGAELVRRDMGDRRFGALRQEDADAVAARHAEGAKRVGEAVRGVLEAGEGPGLDAAVVVLVDEREAVGIGGVAVADVDADVVAPGHAPAERATDLVVRFPRLEHPDRLLMPKPLGGEVGVAGVAVIAVIFGIVGGEMRRIRGAGGEEPDRREQDRRRNHAPCRHLALSLRVHAASSLAPGRVAFKRGDLDQT